MYRMLLATLLLLPGATEMVVSEEARPNVPQLIERLGDSRFESREEAGKLLLEQGPSALPELRKALAHSDAEVRRRVEGLLPALERAAGLEPKRVTLRLTRKSVRDAVAEIAKQTGYSIRIDPNPNHDRLLYDFNLNNVTFWEAMERIIETGDLHLHGDNNQTFYVQSGRRSPFVHHNGIVRLTAQGFQYQRHINFFHGLGNDTDGQSRSESLTFSFLVSTEPKVPLLALGEVKLISAFDDQNRSMLPPVQPADEAPDLHWAGAVRRFFLAQGQGRALHEGYPEGSNKTHTLSTEVALVRPTATSQRVKSIKGTVMATLLVDQRPEIVVDDPLNAKDKKFTSGKVTVVVNEAGPGSNGDGSYRMKIHVTDSMSRNGRHQFHWVNSLGDHFELVDDKGKKYAYEHTGWENVDADQAQIELHFTAPEGAKLGKPAKLIYNKWITLQHPVEFEFSDLPLP